jgi:hypothetical protein
VLTGGDCPVIRADEALALQAIAAASRAGKAQADPDDAGRHVCVRVSAEATESRAHAITELTQQRIVNVALD